MKRNPFKKIHFFMIILLLAVSIGSGSSAFASSPMPAFSLQSAVDGKKVDSAQFLGKVILVTFWATWCPPCMQEIPSLISLQEEFADKGFTVVGVSVDQGGSKPVKRVVEKTGINYPVLMADSDITRDFGGIIGIPTSFLIDQQGNIVKSYPGYVGHKVLVEDIKKLFP